MATIQINILIEEQNVETKYHTLKMADLDPDAVMIVQTSRVRMLKRIWSVLEVEEAEEAK